MANEPNYRIIAIDPGGTTGWATYSAFEILYREEGKLTLAEYTDEAFRCGQMGPGEHHEQLYAFLELQHVQHTIIVCERFDFRGDDRADINLMAREYIGVVKLFSADRGVDVVWQWPFEAVGKKSFVQPSHLKSMGLWVSGGSSQWIHAMDAYRHLLHYMATKLRRVDLLKRMGK